MSHVVGRVRAFAFSLSITALPCALGGCVSAPPPTHATDAESSRPRLVVELLALDLSTCGRCLGTGDGLDGAMQSLGPALREAGVDVEMRRIVVQTAEEAEALRFAVSPTIRVNGRDVPVALRESACADCVSICSTAGGVDCRVWIWRGEEYTAPPKAMLIDAILRAYAHAWDERAPTTEPFVLPENLKRFFAAKTAKAATTSGVTETAH